MAKLPHANSRRMYSWWWDSHISPKNSRWLQENLTDMDAKVKSMIKLIEEDADSFARRAEMYYKKRPELMKMVEEFYRAYRALAERYDHATGALRQAHRTMTEAFPNQVPSGLTEDELASFANENDPETPDDQYAEDRKGLKQLNDSLGPGDDGKFRGGRVRRGLTSDEAGEKDQSAHNAVELEKEIQTLREALAKFEAEKELNLAQYKQSLEKLSNRELEFSNVQEDSKKNKAEDEVESLKLALKVLEVEKEANLVQYQQCLERIKDMDGMTSCTHKNIFDLNERAQKAEAEAQSLKLELATVESEKATSIDQYKQSLEKISILENKLVLVEEQAKVLNARAEEAETEAGNLKKALAELCAEKETNVARFQQLLDTISTMEKKISCATEELQMLNGEIENGVTKLKDSEEKCILLEKSNQSLHYELESLKLKMDLQSEELMEKSRAMGMLWTTVQEERLRFVEAETAFQTLQLLHAQTEEEMRSLALELENRSLILRDMETCNQSLLNESLKIKEENKSLNERNVASLVSINDLQNEITRLWETKGKLEGEVELRTDQRNALQQDIYCLEQELNGLNKKYLAMLDQVEAVGFNPECLQSQVKCLQDENLNLKEAQERITREKVDLFEKLENLEKIVEKNAHLEKSLSDLSASLEGARDEILALGKTIRSISEEKSTLLLENTAILTQLQVAKGNLEKLTENNSFMEKSVSDAQDEIEGLKIRLKTFEESCQTLEDEKSILINEKATLVSQVEITRQGLEDFEKKYQGLEENYTVLEKERESALHEVDELRSTVKGSKFKEEKQMIEIENLHRKVSDLQKTSVGLQEENLKLLDEKITLVKDFLDLQEKNNTLEGENLLILGETAFFSNLSLIFKNIISEESLEIEELRSTMEKLQVLSVGFEDEISVLQGKLEEAQLENMDFQNVLKKTETDLIAITLVNHQLHSEIENGKDLLGQMETEISETKCKVSYIENEKLELQNIVVGLKEKNDEIKMLWDETVRERNDEVTLWESQATNLVSELHTTSLFLAFLEEKSHELTGLLKNLEEETNSKDRGIELLKEGISNLEGENREIRAQLAEYAPAIESLKDCISSLENTTCLHKELRNKNHENVKVATENHLESHDDSSADQKDTDSLSELQDLERRIEVVGKTVIETNSKLEAAERQMEELGSKDASKSANSQLDNGISTIDIMLDQISECSSFGIGGKECITGNTADLNGKENVTTPREEGVDFDSGIIVEKALGVDNLAIAKRYSLPNQELDKTKILERLNSDCRKLTDLQITLKDLKKRVVMSDKRIVDGKSFGEYESVEGQLVKAEEDIIQLSDLNGKLIKNIDNSDDDKGVVELEENRILRRKFLEQARKASERIGQLQLEVQNIQFLMLKLDGKSGKDKTRRKSETGTKTRTSLHNYLGLRTSDRKKNSAFCGCVHTPSTAD